MAAEVVEADLEQRRLQEAIDVADIILQYYPNFAYVMAKQGTAYALQIQVEFADKYPRPIDIPTDLRPRYQLLREKNLPSFASAEALGWREDQ
jgi:hypothetical protein